MPDPRLSDAEILRRLREVFRSRGYEGASLSLISAATGLRRSSLYHRFPGGKDEMARRVLEQAAHDMTAHTLAPLGEPGDLATRLRRVADRLLEYYGGGAKACLLETLTIAANADPGVGDLAAGAYDALAGAFARTAREAGCAPAAARRRAEDAVIAIEGALVVSRVRRDPRIFARVVRGLPDLLTRP